MGKLPDFPGHKPGAGLGMEQQVLELVLMWDAGTCRQTFFKRFDCFRFHNHLNADTSLLRFSLIFPFDRRGRNVIP